MQSKHGNSAQVSQFCHARAPSYFSFSSLTSHACMVNYRRLHFGICARLFLSYLVAGIMIGAVIVDGTFFVAWTRTFLLINIANAGQISSHNLQPLHLEFRLNAIMRCPSWFLLFPITRHPLGQIHVQQPQPLHLYLRTTNRSIILLTHTFTFVNLITCATSAGHLRMFSYNCIYYRRIHAFIRESIRRIAEYAADIAEITINCSYKLTS